MKTKQRYRIRNWRNYNESLKQRGSLTFWFSEEAITHWHNTEQTGSRGRPELYTDIAIECALTLRAVYGLALRATEGFLSSLIKLGNLGLSCPDYTTLCKRQSNLNINLPLSKKRSSKEGMHVVVDSTGLKVFGEGEWKVRQHGWCKHRRWRKLHLAVDASSHLIEAVVLSSNDFKDSELLPDLLDSIDEQLATVSGDGGYDSKDNYELVCKRGAKPLIPPRKDAVISQHGNCHKPPAARDEVIRDIRRAGSRKTWKKQSGYHRRSLSETAMYRFKTAFGDRLRARTFDNQSVETFIKCSALNKMMLTGKSDSYLAT